MTYSIIQDANELRIEEEIRRKMVDMLGYFGAIEFIQQQRPPIWSGNYHRRMRWCADIHALDREEDVDAIACFVVGS